MNPEEQEICAAFKKDNERWAIELPVLPHEFGEFLLAGGFDFAYCKSRSNGKLNYIDFKTCHRMTSDGYIRYYADGRFEEISYEIMKKGNFNGLPAKDLEAITRVSNIEFNFQFNKLKEKVFGHSEYEFFWRNESPFSQWHRANFRLNDIEYSSAEQFMMAKKAELFDDRDTQAKILSTANVRKQKELGRQVRNYNDAVWEAHRIKIVYIANNLKFSQNQHLKSALLETAGKLLVEASPYDTIWGIGLSDEDPLRFDKANWKGENLLGKILTQLREDYQQTEKYI